MLKKSLLCALCSLLICFAVFSSALADGYGSPFMYVDTGNSGSLHLRAWPDSRAPSLGLYPSGTPVTVEGFASDAWAAVRVDGRQGYMNTQYLSGNAPASSAGTAYPCSAAAQRPAVRQQVTGVPASPMKPMYVSTGCGSLHLRAYASQSAQSLGLYPNGTAVSAADLGNGWSYVLAGGLYGCMMTQYLSPNPPYAEYSDSPTPSVNPYVCSYHIPIHQYPICYPQPTSSPCSGVSVTVRNPNSSFVYLRSSRNADRRDNVLAQVPVGTQLVLVERGQYWSRVNCGGTEGYMVSRYLN